MKFPSFSLDRCLPFNRLLIWCLIALAGAGRLWGDNRVAVRAKSDRDYEAQKFGGGTPKDQTYLFFQGRFFGGTTRDTVLEKMPFMQIATTLAAGLAKQHFYPTRDLVKADLLIIVHWGVTTVTLSHRELFGQTTLATHGDDAERLDLLRQMRGNELASGINPDSATNLAMATRGIDDFIQPGALARTEMLQRFDALAQETAIGSNARLLGFADDLQKDRRSFFGTCEGAMLRSMLSDERYFVVLLAYDYQALLKEHEHKLLWSARLSMQSPGMNFRAGMAHMSNVGGVVFGHQTDGVKVRLPPERETKVEIGPIRVLSMPATP